MLRLRLKKKALKDI